MVCIAVATALGAAPQSGWTPSWVVGGACRLVGDVPQQARPIDPYSPGVPCAGESATLSCDAKNAASFDLDRSIACRLTSLPWRRARAVVFVGRDTQLHGSLVQTVEVDSDGRLLIAASRRLSTPANVNLPVGTAALLRIERPGAAPVTLEVPADPRDPVPVPPVLAGGEVFVGLATQPFTPINLVLSGQGVRIIGEVRERRWTAISPVSPGSYRLTPRYLGGVVGATQEVVVLPERTSTIVFAPKDVGALHVEGEASLCHEADEVRVVRRTSRNGGRVESEVASVGRTPDCRYEFEGLPGAIYTVVFTNRATGALAEAVADVVPGRVALVRASAPSVRLLGSVLRDGRPVEGTVELLLSKSDTGIGGASARTRVMSAGAFELTAPEAGEYVASLAIDGLLVVGTEKSIVLKEGVNRLDWEIPAGSLTVDIEGWDRQSDVVLDIRRVGEDQLGVVASGRGLAPGENLPVVIQGLQSGTFELVARQVLANGERRISARHSVAINEQRSTERVTLTLRSYSAEIEVVGPDGRRIAAARVTPSEGAGITESALGLFSLEASVVEPGAPVMISAAGYAPTCISAPNGGRHTVVMAYGIGSRVTYTNPPAPLSGPVGRLHWSGLACQLPIDRFPSEILSVDSETRATTFRVSGLPPNTAVTLVVGGSGFPTESVSFRAGQDAVLSLRRFR